MSDISELRAAFSGQMLISAEEKAPFLTDWRKLYRGQALAVVQPDTARDAAAVVAWCAATGTPVVPQGGNTGLSGGATPDASGRAIVLSLARLNRIRSVDPANSTLIAEAGCTLHAVRQAADAAGKLFPLSLASEGSCTVGGNLATNAGGTSVLRYGSARELCLGLEVVTASGAVWNGLRSLRKDNAGLDVRDLFVGSEGTLGVITAAVLKLHPRPAARRVAVAGIALPEDALALLDLAQRRLGAELSAFELVSHLCLDLVLRHFPSLRLPLADPSPWYVLLEVTDPVDDACALAAAEDMLGEAVEHGLATDAVIAASLSQADSLWALRERVSDAQALEGHAIKHDVAVPISRLPAFIAAAQRALLAEHPDLRLGVFGHVGDGNLHFNVLPASGDPGLSLLARQAAINRIVHDLVHAQGGSISAEHGLGVLRRDEAARYKSATELSLIRAVKTALDPHGIMNPGKAIS